MRWSAAALTAVLVLVGCGGEARDDSIVDRDDLTDPPAETPDRDEAAQWEQLSEAPVALTEVAAAAFGGKVWTAGGLDESGAAVTVVQIFDPTFGTWEDGPALPEAVHHAALVSSGDVLYLLGGYAGPGFDQPTAAVRRLDVETGQWTDGADLPAPRAAGAAAWDGERLVYGGGVGPDGLSGDVIALAGEAWEPVGELSRPREHLAATSDGRGRTWFLAGRTGGLDSNLGAADLLEGSQVTALPDVPTARGGVAAFWSPATGACVVGGEHPGGTFADVECLNPDGDTTVLPPLEHARHGLGAAVVEGAAYVLLGGPEPGLSVSAAAESLRLEEGQ